MRISVIPFYDHFLENRIFEFENAWTSHWQDGNVSLYNECKRRGYTIATWDVLEPKNSDIVIFLDYPDSLQTVLQIKADYPNIKTVLMLYETPLNNPHWFNLHNHSFFDAVLTYNDQLVDNKKYFKLCLPIGMPQYEAEELEFSERKPLVMVNTNRYLGLKASSRPWHYFDRSTELKRQGWYCSGLSLLNSRIHDLNGARRKIARAAERLFNEDVDLFGRGWEGRHTGWFYRFFSDSKYGLSKGVATEDKLQLLKKYRFTIAYENFEGDVGYISEKIFDAIYAGTVPIYRGDANIARYVWEDCFIDGRAFANESDLLKFIVQCPEEKWLELKAAGKKYLSSDAIKQFQPQAYVNSILSVAEQLLQK